MSERTACGPPSFTYQVSSVKARTASPLPWVDPGKPRCLGVCAIALPAVRKLGIEVAAREAVAHLTRSELDGFFIHVDADCLDDAVMPAVDFRLPGGLTLEELATALRIALTSGNAVGLEVAIYNPSLDEDGSAGRALARVLKEALHAAAPSA
jgi:arginase